MYKYYSRLVCCAFIYFFQSSAIEISIPIRIADVSRAHPPLPIHNTQTKASFDLRVYNLRIIENRGMNAT